MSELITVEITNNPIDITRAISAVEDPSYGALNTFIGVVRDNHSGKTVKALTYDVHKTLTVKELRKICEIAASKWPRTKYYVSHYHGTLPVGGVSLIIVVGAPHRPESFDACRYVLEEIKRRAPIWKKEHYEKGESDWLPGHSLQPSLQC